MDPVDLPDATTDRLRQIHRARQQAEQQWQQVMQTVCDMAGIDPSDARIDLDSGTLLTDDDE
jgi:hypothetical protein